MNTTDDVTITCADCGETVYRLKEQIHTGDQIVASSIEGVSGYPSPNEGEVIACPNCKSESGIRRGIVGRIQ